MKETFQRRFAELENSFSDLHFQPGAYTAPYVADGQWRKWATSAQNLILAVFGQHSPHYQNFVEAYTKCRGESSSVKGMNAIFLSAKEDFDGGYVFDVDLRISGEVFGDFIRLARQSLSEGYKDVAAVLACAALEDVLKRYASANGIAVDDKAMTDVVNSLKSNGLVVGAQKSLLDAMPKVRNFAMHANWDKISAPDVSSVIGFVEQLLLSKFTP
ncbi:DUF4145 domain-containing protein [Geomonas subterranea]|uniref:DUF4145 domain-containing protein n=1 Tax=Geomonas subterranea TaxID=2847989 RepID=UPI001CD1E151|nr:DUF4145 domain-containing protein [Geomonas fuzhouensis]